MLDKTVDLRARLNKARADMHLVDAELASLEAEKAAASGSREAFDQWRVDHAAAAAERERLVLHIDLLEKELERAGALDADEDRRKQHAAKEIANAKLAQRIRADAARANKIMTDLVRDVAKSVAEDQIINANLPEGLASLLSADVLARELPALPREEIKRTRIWLWCRHDNGAPVGDQEMVRDKGGRKGILEINFRPDIPCVMLPFDEVAFHPAEPAQRPTPLWSIRLVSPDAPSVEFDGMELRQPREVLAALARASRAKEPRERPIQTELVPVGVVREDAAAEN